VDAARETGLDQHTDASVRQLEHAHDERRRADRVQIVRAGIFVVLAALSEEQDHPALARALSTAWIERSRLT